MQVDAIGAANIVAKNFRRGDLAAKLLVSYIRLWEVLAAAGNMKYLGIHLLLGCHSAERLSTYFGTRAAAWLTKQQGRRCTAAGAEALVSTAEAFWKKISARDLSQAPTAPSYANEVTSTVSAIHQLRGALSEFIARGLSVTNLNIEQSVDNQLCRAYETAMAFRGSLAARAPQFNSGLGLATRLVTHSRLANRCPYFPAQVCTNTNPRLCGSFTREPRCGMDHNR